MKSSTDWLCCSSLQHTRDEKQVADIVTRDVSVLVIQMENVTLFKDKPEITGFIDCRPNHKMVDGNVD